MLVELVDAWRAHEHRKHIALMEALRALDQSGQRPSRSPVGWPPGDGRSRCRYQIRVGGDWLPLLPGGMLPGSEWRHLVQDAFAERDYLGGFGNVLAYVSFGQFRRVYRWVLHVVPLTAHAIEGR